MNWTHSQIQKARKTPLRPLLERLGYQLEERRDGNWRIIGEHADIVVKDHYWIKLGTPGHTAGEAVSGNTIDFLVNVHGLSFADAMSKEAK